MKDSRSLVQKPLIRPDDIALTFEDLAELPDVQTIVRDLHNYLAANESSMTRSESLSQQLINLLFCKIVDELNNQSSDNALRFQRYPDESDETLAARIRKFFSVQVKEPNEDIFEQSDSITLDDTSLAYVVDTLQCYRVVDANRDVVGGFFESILGHSLKGSKGQFFTPRNVVEMMTDIVDPNPGERIIDPACGSGGFLVMALRHLNGETENQAPAALVGIDKDEYLAKVARIHLRLLGAENAQVFAENSLSQFDSLVKSSNNLLAPGTYDVVLTNPPFGSKLKITDRPILKQFDLAHDWRKDKVLGTYAKTNRVKSTPPQVLFVERCLDLLRDGGRLGIVLPETLIGSPSYEHIIQYLQERVRFLAVVSMPDDLFQPHTHAKSCILVAQKEHVTDDYNIFMGIVDWCGHDSRGNPTVREDPITGDEVLLDDVPMIAPKYEELTELGVNDGQATHLGFLIRKSQIQDNVLVPKYYDPDIQQTLDDLSTTHDLLSIGDLRERKFLTIKTGVEVGRLAYGTGPIPFVRTSDISNWEIKIDPKHCVSEDIYEEYCHRASVQPGDILLVRDGTYLVGTSCILTKYDTKILFQSHIYRLRVHKPEVLDPFLLFAALNSPIVKRQILAKRFSQHIIETLGSRVNELKVPIPKDTAEQMRIADKTREIVETRARLREEARAVTLEVEGDVEELQPGVDPLL